MQHWEYLTGSYQGIWWWDSLGRRGQLPVGRDLHGHTLDYTGEPTGVLNDLGEQGWELCGVAGRNGDGVYQLFLKRPRP